MSKISNLSPSDVFRRALNAPELVFGRSSAPDHAVRAYDAPQAHQSAGEGTLPPRIPIPSPFNAFSISILRPLHNKIPGHACVAQDAAMCTFARPWIKNSEVISHRYIYSSRCFCSSCYWGWGRPLQKGLKLRRFKSDRDEIWHECSSNINNHRLTRGRLLLVLLRHMCLLGQLEADHDQRPFRFLKNINNNGHESFDYTVVICHRCLSLNVCLSVCVYLSVFVRVCRSTTQC